MYCVLEECPIFGRERCRDQAGTGVSREAWFSALTTKQEKHFGILRAGHAKGFELSNPVDQDPSRAIGSGEGRKSKGRQLSRRLKFVSTRERHWNGFRVVAQRDMASRRATKGTLTAVSKTEESVPNPKGQQRLGRGECRRRRQHHHLSSVRPEIPKSEVLPAKEGADRPSDDVSAVAAAPPAPR
ncbi:hypothetical protein EVAR_40304_1 [Eumeta japonica]|uniref:Uncharacterized protein n=1 Tax=Eumeta variegata TaxID=151549 RepID=A0A4C1YBT1_EUMVA|nr:hypothetical protein EVAR_40304_1 [Eumeta japonica]